MKSLRYNELDELDWEYKHPVPDDEDYWGQDSSEMYVDEFCATIPDMEPEAEDDETGQGIFGNELNHKQRAKFEPDYEHPGDMFHVASSGNVAGVGDGDEVIFALMHLLVPDRKYHFEFKFFNAE